VLLWIVVPKHGTFVVPTTSREFGYDLGLIWWLFIIWLPWSGFGFGPEPGENDFEKSVVETFVAIAPRGAIIRRSRAHPPSKRYS
jgi:hypothetical protein